MYIVKPYTTPSTGHGWRVDSSFEQVISPMSRGFELCVHDSDSTSLFYKMVNVSSPHTQVLTSPTWWWVFYLTASHVGGKNLILGWSKPRHVTTHTWEGVVGLNIDKCIEINSRPTYFTFPLQWENASWAGWKQLLLTASEQKPHNTHSVTLYYSTQH